MAQILQAEDFFQHALCLLLFPVQIFVVHCSWDILNTSLLGLVLQCDETAGTFHSLVSRGTRLLFQSCFPCGCFSSLTIYPNPCKYYRTASLCWEGPNPYLWHVADTFLFGVALSLGQACALASWRNTVKSLIYMAAEWCQGKPVMKTKYLFQMTLAKIVDCLEAA